VEVDEALFFKRKYNRGCRKASVWIFGGVESRTCVDGTVLQEKGRMFLVPVPNRGRVTLHGLIRKHIAPGTLVRSDGWKSYTRLGRQYRHQVVEHVRNFVNPNNGAHTQTIEGTWKHIRDSLPSGGMRPSKLVEYLAEYVYSHDFNPSQNFNPSQKF